MEKELKKLIEENKVIPFVGAGVSKAVKSCDGVDVFPDWGELLHKLAEGLNENDTQIIKNYLNRPHVNYLRVVDDIQEFYPTKALYGQKLDEIFDITRESIQDNSLDLARAIWGLNQKLIITTNYDKILHWASDNSDNTQRWDIKSVAEQGLSLSIELKKQTVWHIHGHIENKDNIVLTTDSYEKLYTDNEKYKTALETLKVKLATKSFLFIGFSLNDEYFINELEKISRSFGDYGVVHYVLLKEGRKLDKRFDKKIIPIYFDDYGQKLIDKINSLKPNMSKVHRKKITQLIKQLGDEESYIEIEEKLFLVNVFDIIKSEIVVLLHQKYTHISQMVEEIYKEAKNNYNFYHFVTPTTKNRGEYYQRLGELFGITIKDSTEFVDKLSTILENQKILLYINNFEDNTKPRAKELATAIRTLRNCYTNRFNAIIIGQEKLAKMSYNTDSTLSPLNNTIKYTFPNNAQLEYNNIKAFWDSLDSLAKKHIINHIEYDDIGMFDINDPLINQLFWQNIGTKKIDDNRLYWKDNYTKNIFRELMKI